MLRTINAIGLGEWFLTGLSIAEMPFNESPLVASCGWFIASAWCVRFYYQFSIERMKAEIAAIDRKTELMCRIIKARARYA